ncbi:hypothetical protein [Streptomyces chrestomyceticus]
MTETVNTTTSSGEQRNAAARPHRAACVGGRGPLRRPASGSGVCQA